MADYDPAFPTEDEDCIFVSETHPKPKKDPEGKDDKPDVILPPVDLIPLPGQLELIPLPGEADNTSPECSVIEPILPEEPEQMSEPAPTPRAPTPEPAVKLSKVQMLIMKKKAQLEEGGGAIQTSNKPAQVIQSRSTLSIGIGKPKSSVAPKEKLVFAVAKRTKPKAIFDEDSDEDNETRLPPTTTLPKPKLIDLPMTPLPDDLKNRVIAATNRIEAKHAQETKSDNTISPSKNSKHKDSEPISQGDVPALITYPDLKPQHRDSVLKSSADSTIPEDDLYSCLKPTGIESQEASQVQDMPDSGTESAALYDPCRPSTPEPGLGSSTDRLTSIAQELVQIVVDKSPSSTTDPQVNKLSGINTQTTKSSDSTKHRLSSRKTHSRSPRRRTQSRSPRRNQRRSRRTPTRSPSTRRRSRSYNKRRGRDRSNSRNKYGSRNLRRRHSRSFSRTRSRRNRSRSRSRSHSPRPTTRRSTSRRRQSTSPTSPISKQPATSPAALLSTQTEFNSSLADELPNPAISQDEPAAKTEDGQEETTEGTKDNNTYELNSSSSTISKYKSRGYRRRNSQSQSRSPDRRKSESPSKRRSKSSARRRTRSPSQHRKRTRTRSPARRGSKSPARRRRRSRTPVRRRPSPARRRTRSLARRRARSPVRQKSRSPARQRSRSSARRRSKSQTKRRTRSPVERKSKSPARCRSKSSSRYQNRRDKSADQRRSRSSLSPHSTPLPISKVSSDQDSHQMTSSTAVCTEAPPKHRSLSPLSRSMTIEAITSALASQSPNNQDTPPPPPPSQSQVQQQSVQYMYSADGQIYQMTGMPYSMPISSYDPSQINQTMPFYGQVANPSQVVTPSVEQDEPPPPPPPSKPIPNSKKTLTTSQKPKKVDIPLKPLEVVKPIVPLPKLLAEPLTAETSSTSAKPVIELTPFVPPPPGTVITNPNQKPAMASGGRTPIPDDQSADESMEISPPSSPAKPIQVTSIPMDKETPLVPARDGENMAPRPPQSQPKLALTALKEDLPLPPSEPILESKKREPKTEMRPDPAVTILTPPMSVEASIPLDSINTEEGKGKKEKIDDDKSERRRSSRIKTKETRVAAEKRMQERRKTAQQIERRASDAGTDTNPEDEETVDFVIESNTEKPSIDLPNRSNEASPIKPNNPSPSAPGKLKLRWLKASKCDQPSKDKVSPNAEVCIRPIVSDEPQTTDKEENNSTEDTTDKSKKEPAHFERIEDNIYLTNSESKKESKRSKEAKRMVCDCTTCPEDRDMNIPACGDDCLNRMLMIECGSRCPCGEYCTNKSFQRHNNAPVDIFLTENKGHGLRATRPIQNGQFIREYVGEILGHKEFKHRVKQYARDQHRHYYFMALNSDEIIDATQKGNISRFINHSCDPNAETQKWTVNGKLRIGFFAKRDIQEKEEITFDYQFERYGKEAQKCYCGAENCRGFIGGDQSSTKLSASEKIIQPAHSKSKKKDEKRRETDFSDATLSDEIAKLQLVAGLTKSAQVLQLSRLMVRSEAKEDRMNLLSVIMDTTSQNCLRLFLNYHGLSLLWSWMVDIASSGAADLKLMILRVLKVLPITNKNVIQESKVLSLVTQWSEDLKQKMANNPPNPSHNADSSDEGVQAVVSDLIDRVCKAVNTQDSDVMSVDDDSSQDGSASPLPSADSPETLSQISVYLTELLDEWSLLREQFKIPKKQEERKRTAQEIDHSPKSDRPRPQAVVRKPEKKKKRDRSPDLRRGRDRSPDARRGRSRRDDGDDQAAKLTKQERRAMFEAQAKAEEKEFERRQYEQRLHTDESYIAYDQPYYSEGRYHEQVHLEPPHYDDGYQSRYGERRYTEDSFDNSFHSQHSQSSHYQEVTPQHATVSTESFNDPSVPIYTNPNYLPVPLPKPDPTPPAQFTQPQIMPYQDLTHHGQQTPVRHMPLTGDAAPLQTSISTQPGPAQSNQRTGTAQTQLAIPSQYAPAAQFGVSTQVAVTPQVGPAVVDHLGNVVVQSSQPLQYMYPQYNQPATTVQVVYMQPQVDEPPPPPAPANTLPPDWKSAKDAEGRTYYYHKVTRQTQWEVPRAVEEKSAEPAKTKKKKATSAPADTSSSDLKKVKETFKSKISVHIRSLLNGFMKSDCKSGRITNKEDYKYLAKKLTHAVLDKELKHCKHHEDLEVNDNVKFKAKEFVRKYMARSGAVYKKHDRSP